MAIPISTNSPDSRRRKSARRPKRRHGRGSRCCSRNRDSYLSPLAAIVCTHRPLSKVHLADSLDGSLIREGSGRDGIWAGAIWRSPPGKRGVALHAALVERPCSRIRRLAGCRAQEMRFTRFLRNAAVTADEMVCHAVGGTAARGAGRHIVVAQDTSELALGGRRLRANGYLPVGN